MLQVMASVSQRLGLYGQASDLAGQAFELVEADRPEDHPDLATALLSMGTALRHAGAFDSARVVLSRAVRVHEAHRDPHPAVFGDVLEQLANVEVYLGRVASAEELLVRGLSMREELLGRYATPTLNTLSTLGRVLRRQGRHGEAEAVFREVLLRRRSSSVDDPLALASDLLQLGGFLRDFRGDLGEAEALLLEALEVTREPKGRAKRHEVWALESLADLKEVAGEWGAAEDLHLEAVDTRMKTYGEIHPSVSESLLHYGEFLTRAGRPAEGEAHLRRAVVIDLDTSGESHTRHAGTLAGLGKALAAQGRLAEADSMLSRALEIRIAAQGRQVSVVAQVSATLADVKTRRGQFEEAEVLLDGAAATLREQQLVGEIPQTVHAAFTRLYEAWNRPADAARYRALVEGSD
jgi:tetratricopeptide (TPR) repeat protein